MSQDSDGVAEAMRGGAQVGLTLAAQTVEALARRRQHALQREADEQQGRAEQLDRRAQALDTRGVREEMARNQRDRLGAIEPALEIWPSPQRPQASASALTPGAMDQATRVRVVAESAQAHPASAVMDMPPPSTPPLTPQGPSGHTRARQASQQAARLAATRVQGQSR